MGNIPFHYINKDHLIPFEEFLYEKYRHNLENLSGPEEFPPSMVALSKKYPEIASSFCQICRKIQVLKLSEDSYLSNGMDISVYSNLRYLPKPQHTHQFFEILFVFEGQCVEIVEETTIRLHKGDICFLAPDIPHQVIINNHETIAYNILIRTSTFQNTFANIYGNNDIISDFFTQNLYRNKKGTSPYILCKTDCEDFFIQSVYKMIEEEQHPKKFAKRYLNMLFEFFIVELLRKHEFHFTIGEATDNIEHESITAILRYIQGNYKNLTLSEAARFFHYSEAHLSRMVKRFTGQNFSGIIKTIKLQKATTLLIETHKTISDIVEEIGYTDNSHFYKIFKQHYGMTPIRYKELHEQDNR